LSKKLKICLLIIVLSASGFPFSYLFIVVNDGKLEHYARGIGLRSWIGKQIRRYDSTGGKKKNRRLDRIRTKQFSGSYAFLRLCKTWYTMQLLIRCVC
jgi:hypothetical protein